MKTFNEYLIESKKKYDFRIKIAGDVTTEQETNMKSLLGRFTVGETLSTMKKSKTPIQSLPLDFPQVKNCEVNIYEVTLDYPTTAFELTEYLSTNLGVGKSHLVVRSPLEPQEEYQNIEPTREGALLDDPDYKESPNANPDEYFGDKYNTSFLKELNDVLKLQRKERGEEIPSSGPAKFSTDADAGTLSPVSGKGK